MRTLLLIPFLVYGLLGQGFGPSYQKHTLTTNLITLGVGLTNSTSGTNGLLSLNLVSGTNVVLTTNGTLLTISSAAGGSTLPVGAIGNVLYHDGLDWVPYAIDGLINLGFPNSTGIVHWSQLVGVPAGFADNTDAFGAPGSGDDVWINNVDHANPNFTNSSTIEYTVDGTGTNVSASVTSSVALDSELTGFLDESEASALYQATNANLTLLQAYGPTTWQATNANLTALAANPNIYQATNGNLTLLSAYGPTTWQATNAALTALAGNPNLYQATNGNLTLLSSYGPTTWQATNANLTLLQAYGPTTWQATNAALTALAGNPQLYQATNANLTALAGASITGAGNFMRTRTGVPREIWVPANAMNPSSTSPASIRTNAWATTTDFQTLEVYDFDSATDENVDFTLTLPTAWDAGTVKAKFVWKQVAAEASTTNVWAIAGGSIADNEAGGNTLGTAITVYDVGLNDTNKVAITAATSAITIGGTPSAGHFVWFRVYRDANNSEDSMAGDASLIGVHIQYTETTTEPSAW